MAKSLIKVFLVLDCFLLGCFLFCGCSRQENVVDTRENSPLKLLINEFSQKGPKKQLQEWEFNIMRPALALPAKLVHANEQEKKEALRHVRNWQEILDKVVPVKYTDSYLHFSKCYLVKLEHFLQCKKNIDKIKVERELEDARLAFINVQSEIFKGKGTYRLKDIKEDDLQVCTSYEQFRHLLAMPAVCLDNLEVQGEIHQPTLWAHGDRFLYVDFVDGKANLIKLHVNPYFEKKKNRKLAKEIYELEANIIEPAIKIYSEYHQIKKSVNAKQSDKVSLAKELVPWIKVNLPRLKAYQKQFAAVAEDNLESFTYVKCTKAYLALMVESLEVAEKLPDLANEQDEFAEFIKRGDLLEGRLVLEAGCYYANARSWLLENKGTFCFPNYMVKHLSKKPWQISIENWTQMPGQLVQSWIERDSVLTWKMHKRKIYVWVQGNEFLIGEFFDERLQKWRLQRLNDGFWYKANISQGV